MAFHCAVVVVADGAVAAGVAAGIVAAATVAMGGRPERPCAPRPPIRQW